LASLITCRFLLVHPQLNYIDSFHSEAKICNIKYNLGKKSLLIRFPKGGAEIEGRKYTREEKGKSEILGKLVNY